jgi:murein DD-endopeptidase MepM/ murein hydrolase activator NlpD
MAVAVGLLVFAFAALGPVAQPARASTWVWPTTGRITQPYGCTGFWAEPPYGNCRHFHKGIDIANNAWTKIRAASSGVVSYVGYNPYDPAGQRAWIVTIKHDNGTVGWYAHMQAKSVAGARKGDRVSPGQLIGYMGKTGMATGVHLHFGLMRNGAPVNPKLYLDGKPSSGSASTASEGSTSTPRKTPRAQPKVDVPVLLPRVIHQEPRRFPIAV